MNVSEMKAGAEFYELGYRQGWTPSDWLSILHDFITLKQMNVELLAYAKELAAEED